MKLFLLLLGVALVASNPTPFRPEFEVSDSSNWEKFWKPETIFIYKYKGHILTGIKEPIAPKSGIRYEADIKVARAPTSYKQSLFVKVENLKVWKVENKQVLRPEYPLPVDTSFEEIRDFPDMEKPIILEDFNLVKRFVDDKDFVLNFKKSILSMLKVDTDEVFIQMPETMQEPTVTRKLESSIMGDCYVSYLTEMIDVETLSITKVLNAKNCTNKPEITSVRPENPYDSEEMRKTMRTPLTGEPSIDMKFSIKKNTGNWMITEIEARSQYEIDPIRENQPRMETFTVQTMELFSHEPESLPANMRIRMPITDSFGLHMNLKNLVKVQEQFGPGMLSTLPSLSFYDSLHKKLFLGKGLQLPIHPFIHVFESLDTCELSIVHHAVSEISRSVEDKLMQMNEMNLEKIAELIKVLHRCDENKFSEIFDYYLTREASKVKKEVFLSIVARIPLKEVLSTVQNKLREMNTLQIVKFFTEINMLEYSSIQYLNKLKDVCEDVKTQLSEKPVVFRTCVQAVGAHLYKTMTLHMEYEVSDRSASLYDRTLGAIRGNEPEEEFTDVLVWLETKLRETTDRTTKLAVIKAMGNSGVKRFSRLLEKIVLFVRNDEQSLVESDHCILRTAAVDAIRSLVKVSMYKKDWTFVNKMRDIFLSVISNKDVCFDARFTGIRSLIDAKPTMEDLMLATRLIQSETDSRLLSYVYGYLKQLSYSNLPTFSYRAVMLKKVLRSIPNPRVFESIMEKITDYVSEHENKGVQLKILDDSSSYTFPKKMLISLTDFFSGRSFDSFDITTWTNSLPEFVRNIWSKWNEPTMVTRDFMRNIIFQKRSVPEIMVLFKYQGLNMIVVNEKDILDLLTETYEQFSRRERNTDMSFMLHSPVMFEMTPTFIGLPIYTKHSECTLIKTVKEKIQTTRQNVDHKLHIRMKRLVETRVALELPGQEIGIKHSSKIAIHLPLKLKLEPNSYKLYDELENETVMKTWTRVMLFKWTPRNDIDHVLELPEPNVPVKTLTQKYPLFGREVLINTIVPIKTPLEGLKISQEMKLTPLASHKLFTFKWLFPRNQQVNEFDIRTIDSTLSWRSNLNLPREHFPQAWESDMRLDGEKAEKYKHKLEFFGADERKVTVELLHLHSLDDVAMKKTRFVVNVEYEKPTSGHIKVCVRGRFNAPKNHFVEESQDEAKFAVSLAYGQECESDDATSYYLEMTSRSSLSEFRNTRLSPMKEACRELESECHVLNYNSQRCFLLKEKCDNYLWYINKFMDTKIVGKLPTQWMTSEDDVVKSVIKSIIVPRYWFLRTTQMHRYETYERDQTTGDYDFSADIKITPSLTSPDDVQLQFDLFGKTEKFNNLPLKVVTPLVKPIFYYPENSLLINLVNAIIPKYIMSSLKAISVQEAYDVCTVKNNWVKTFDGLVYNTNSLMVENCKKLLSADCVDPQQFKIILDGETVKVFKKDMSKELKYDIITPQDFTPRSSDEFQIFKSDETHKVLRLRKYNIFITIDRDNTVKIHVPRSYRNSVCGLCGNRDGDFYNDLLVPRPAQLQGRQYFPLRNPQKPLVQHFVQKWTISPEQCPEQARYYELPTTRPIRLPESWCGQDNVTPPTIPEISDEETTCRFKTTGRRLVCDSTCNTETAEVEKLVPVACKLNKLHGEASFATFVVKMLVPRSCRIIPY